ncbi:MAG: methyltransferase [Patescibacteria group bacterium]|nr:methyltransferase [Patescibacteria group bacterium]
MFYLQKFYDHFYVYLTGTIINEVAVNAWPVVIASIVVFSLFLIPLNYRKKTKWIDYSLVGAFFVSLFVEMYGIPLTILFASKYFFKEGLVLPDNVIEFNLLGTGLGMDHAMVYGTILMLLGMILIVLGWSSLYRQVKRGGSFASTGIYKISRNPQYVGFILLIIGWFFGWPTILTLIFAHIMIYKYWRAARSEEADMLELYGDKYLEYQSKTPFMI